MSLIEQSEIRYVTVPGNGCADPRRCEQINMIAMQEEVAVMLGRLAAQAERDGADISEGFVVRAIGRCERPVLQGFRSKTCTPGVTVQIIGG